MPLNDNAPSRYAVRRGAKIVENVSDVRNLASGVLRNRYGRGLSNED